MSTQTFATTDTRQTVTREWETVIDCVHPLAPTIKATQAALRDAGPSCRTQFVADTQLVNGYETVATMREFKLIIDEPLSLGGTNLGPNPAEIVVAALGACQEIVYSTYAALLNIQIDRLEIRVTGHLDPRGFFGVSEVPAGFDYVQYDVKLVSPSPEDKVRRLVEIVNQHCPVLDILQRPLSVKGTVEHNGQLLD